MEFSKTIQRGKREQVYAAKQQNCPPPDIRPAVRSPACFLGAGVFRNPAFRNLHPLSILRLGAVEDVCRALGWLTDTHYRAAPAAPRNVIERFHHPHYVEALLAAEAANRVSAEERAVYGIGTMENPVFPGLYARAATTVGGSILAADLALSGHVSVHFGGGTHHGRPARASGFCYFNDVVFAIQKLLDGGCDRVGYIDLDAHHGDGVEAAFAGNPRVLMASIHEENRWPFSSDKAGPNASNARNASVPPGMNDSEFRFLLHEWVLPAITAFNPDAIVIVCGADALKGDPLSRLALSNVALRQAVLALIDACPCAVVLGGGGYNPWTTVRAWSGIWGAIAGFETPAGLPTAVQNVLQSLQCDLIDDDDIEPAWLHGLDDAPNEGPIREPIKTIARKSK